MFSGSSWTQKNSAAFGYCANVSFNSPSLMDKAARCARSRRRRVSIFAAAFPVRNICGRCREERAARFRIFWSDDALEPADRRNLPKLETARGSRNRPFGVNTINGLRHCADDLATQAVKILRGRRRINDLHVVLRAQRQKTFQTRAAVFGSLPFESVRQQEDNAAQPIPLVFGAGDELVDERPARSSRNRRTALPNR